jgi:hypothetical protein
VAATEDQGRATAEADEDVVVRSPLPLPDICARTLDLRKVAAARFRLAAGEAWMGSGLVLKIVPMDGRRSL